MSYLAAASLVLGACAPAARGIPHVPAPVALEPEELGDGPDLVEEEVRSTERDLLGSVAYDLPLEANTWVEAELDYLVSQRTAVIGRWLERGDFYEPFIKSVLADHGLPSDLYHLAMIESGMVPSARSRVGALGMWQFMPATARLEGLRVDAVVDERLDPVRATHAAARHLRTLHRSFRGDWALAAAAYNAGTGRISRGLQGFGATNFWDLAVWGDLADETKHYVPRLYAMTIIARDRARFGFGPPREDREPFAFDSVKVDLATPLAELAAVGGVAVEELARLNPHLLRRVTPPGTYWVWVPAGMGPGVQQAFLESSFRRGGGHTTYVVRRGDNLGKIAQAAGVPASRIRQLNPETNWERLQIGQRLKLPAGTSRSLAAAAAESEPTAVAPRPSSSGTSGSNGSSRASAANAARPASTASAATSGASLEHKVKEGESLWGIARRYGVSVDELQKANRLSGATIVVGRTLRIPQGGGAANGRMQVALATASPASRPEAPKSAEHVVRAGETLWSIAREYGSTVDAIQGANRIDASVIVPGQRLLIPR